MSLQNDQSEQRQLSEASSFDNSETEYFLTTVASEHDLHIPEEPEISEQA